MSVETKTVIQRYVSHASNYPIGCIWGLGDFLRGCACFFDVCEKENWNLIVDIKHHNISEFLCTTCPDEYSNIGTANINFYSAGDLRSLTDVIYNLGNPAILISNGYSRDTPFSEECKSFLKNVLTFRPSFLDYVRTTYPNKHPYKILHFRLGDRFLLNKTYDTEFINLFNSIDEFSNVENLYIVITDSETFKNYLKFKLKGRANIIILNTKPTHTGIERDIEKMRDTMVEFYLATQAEEIITFSSYCWVSGFMDIIHRVFDVPLISKRLNIRP
jgi:hypothetical protein